MGRDHALDSVRGLAALSVALGHCVLTVTGLAVWSTRISDLPHMDAVSAAARLLYVVFPNDAAVTLFFVLSGHVLWRSFGRSLPQGGVLHRLSDAPDFAVGRGYRLLPTIVAAALPLAWLLNTPGDELVQNMLLLRHNLNGVTWSLQIEVVCGLALFLAHRLVAGRAAGAAALLVASTIAVRLVPVSSNAFLYVLFCPAFLLGALIDTVPRRVWGYPVLMSGLAVMTLSGLVFVHNEPGRALEMLGATGVIGSVGFLQPPVLLSRSLRFLGRISYPLYLSHAFGVTLAWPMVHAATGPHVFAAIAVLAVVSLAITIPLATFIHILVEQPLMRARPRLGPLRLPSRRLVAMPASATLPQPRSRTT